MPANSELRVSLDFRSENNKFYLSFPQNFLTFATAKKNTNSNYITMMEQNIIYVPIALSLLGLIFMLIKMSWVKKQASGSERMQFISKSIKEGALAFLHAEYRLLLIFAIIAAGLLYFISTQVESTSWLIVPAFIFGAIFSASAGNIGMRVATEANARTAEAAKNQFATGVKSFFWWWNSYGTWSCRTSGTGS